MDHDDKDLSIAFCSHTSSSAISTPEDTEHLNESTKGQEECPKPCKEESVFIGLDSEKWQDRAKCKSTVELSGATRYKGGYKNLEIKKQYSNNASLANNLASKRQARKRDHSVQVPSIESLDARSSCTWICKNSACKAVLNADETFCKRCSCCICHLFDDNKDPSLWLVCSTEKGYQDCCGLSCHVECALQHQRVGLIDIEVSMQLDGSYYCASCGKVSGILGCWKKQLLTAKDARRVDILCYRIFLSYRLLEGTSRFKELHGIIEDAKAILEREVGPVDGVSAKMARGIVSRLAVAGEVQKLCSLAVEKAEEWLSRTSCSDSNHQDSLPAACRFQFEEITSSTCLIVLKGTCSSDSIMGYKLWYWKSREQQHMKEPVVFARDQRKVSISNLQPCTEYVFRVISFSEGGDVGHSEAKCFTKSVEIIHKNTACGVQAMEGCSSGAKPAAKAPTTAGASGFKVRNLGRILRRAWAEEEACHEGYCCDDAEEESFGGSDAALRPDLAEEEVQDGPDVSHRRFDPGVAVSVPDLNADITPPPDSSPEEDWCGSGKDGLACCDRSGDSRARLGRRGAETGDGDSALVAAASSKVFSSGDSGQLDDNYEYCVKVIRWLECLGHVEKDFRMKFLTWFSLRSTEQERRVVVTFIRTLIEEPRSLAGQLLDSFLEVVTCKRPRFGFCSKLWH